LQRNPEPVATPDARLIRKENKPRGAVLDQIDQLRRGKWEAGDEESEGTGMSPHHRQESTLCVIDVSAVHSRRGKSLLLA